MYGERNMGLYQDLKERWQEFKQDHPKTATAAKIAGIALAVPAGIAALSGLTIGAAMLCGGLAMIAPPVAAVAMPAAMLGLIGLHVVAPAAATLGAVVAGASALAGGVTYVRENAALEKKHEAAKPANEGKPAEQKAGGAKPRGPGLDNTLAPLEPAVGSTFTRKPAEADARQTTAAAAHNNKDDYGRETPAPVVAAVAPAHDTAVPAAAANHVPEVKTAKVEAPQTSPQKPGLA
jgi:hypothetical protein